MVSWLREIILPAASGARTAFPQTLKDVRRRFPFLRRMIADAGYQGAGTPDAVGKATGTPLKIVTRLIRQGRSPLSGSWRAGSQEPPHTDRARAKVPRSGAAGCDKPWNDDNRS
jgi:hypothetical protein